MLGTQEKSHQARSPSQSGSRLCLLKTQIKNWHRWKMNTCTQKTFLSQDPQTCQSKKMCKTWKLNLTSSKVFSRRRRRRSPLHLRLPLPITVAIQGNPMRRTLEGAIVWSMAWTLSRFLRGTLMLLGACKSWMNPSYSTALRKITRSRCTHLQNSHTMWNCW